MIRRHGAIMDERRARISELIARGKTFRQIHEELSLDENFRNPLTGRPWNIATIKSDVKVISTEWKKIAMLHYDVHVARLMGQILEVRKRAWEQDRLPVILKTLEQEMKLLGLDKMSKTEIDWKEQLRKAGVDPNRTFDDLVQSTYERLVAAGEIEVQEY